MLVSDFIFDALMVHVPIPDPSICLYVSRPVATGVDRANAGLVQRDIWD